MTQASKEIGSTNLDEIEPNSQHVMLIGGTVLSLNIILMTFTIFYWTNNTFHQYISGSSF